MQSELDAVIEGKDEEGNAHFSKGDFVNAVESCEKGRHKTKRQQQMTFSENLTLDVTFVLKLVNHLHQNG